MDGRVVLEPRYTLDSENDDSENDDDDDDDNFTTMHIMEELFTTALLRYLIQ